MSCLIRFSANRSPFSYLIRLFTWSWASHVDIVLPDGRLLGAVPFKGVSIREVNVRDTRVETYRLEGYLDGDPSGKVLKSAISQVGRPYDWRGVLGLALHRRWQDSDSWFCSEFVAWATLTAGAPLLHGEHWRITPRDLLLSPLLTRA